MPFTPFHMGLGMLLKSLLRGSFSLIIFGWAQIVMDIQPLIVLLSGKGALHGFSHTILGATLIFIITAVSGRYVADFFLSRMHLQEKLNIELSNVVLISSAAIGTYSHILLDAIMHNDVHIFWPFSTWQGLWQLVSTGTLHYICIISGIIGLIIYGITFLIFKSRS